MTKMESVNEHLEKVMDLGVAICTTMQKELSNAGVEGDDVQVAPVDQASFSLKEDPFTKQNTLEGLWRDARGNKKGEILFHGDGSFYAEYDVVRPHPTKPQWFIESVVAWGRGETIKSEMKLLPAVT